MDAWINDIFYGRPLQNTDAQYDKMSANHGYGSSKRKESSAEVSQEQMQFMNSKVDSLKLHVTDLEEFFAKNRDELPAEARAGNAAGSGDQQIYWEKKIALLKTKVDALPAQL